MNLLTTWTSRELSMERSCSEMESNFTHPLTDSFNISLRSVQKMSGLFDTDKAGNTTVAGKASKPVLDMEDTNMDFMPNEDFGGILADVPLDLELDYLDSFVDLSNFLRLEESMKGSNPAVSSAVDNGEVKETGPLDFSGIIAHLDPEPIATVVPEIIIPTTSSPKKRKATELVEVDFSNAKEVELVVDVIDVGSEFTVSDHDYVTKKKPKLERVTEAKIPHVTSTSRSDAAPAYKYVDKYRERRDKNNEASRRSRQIRKQKFVDMDKEANELEAKNEVLRKKIAELEELAKSMKAILIKKMTEKK